MRHALHFRTMKTFEFQVCFHPGNPVDFYGKAVIGLPMYLRSFLKSDLFKYRRTPRGLIGNTKESP